MFSRCREALHTEDFHLVSVFVNLMYQYQWLQRQNSFKYGIRLNQKLNENIYWPLCYTLAVRNCSRNSKSYTNKCRLYRQYPKIRIVEKWYHKQEQTSQQYPKSGYKLTEMFLFYLYFSISDQVFLLGNEIYISLCSISLYYLITS